MSSIPLWPGISLLHSISLNIRALEMIKFIYQLCSVHMWSMICGDSTMNYDSIIIYDSNINYDSNLNYDSNIIYIINEQRWFNNNQGCATILRLVVTTINYDSIINYDSRMNHDTAFSPNRWFRYKWRKILRDVRRFSALWWQQ